MSRYYVKVASVHGVGYLDRGFLTRRAAERAATDPVVVGEFGDAVWVVTARERRERDAA